MPDRDLPLVSLSDLDASPDIAVPAGNGEEDKIFLTREKFERLTSRINELADEKAELTEKISRIERRNEASSILNELIKPYAHRTFIFMCVYCGCVGAFIVASMYGFSLESGVLEALVGSTAVTVIGLVGMVLTGIFVGARGKD